MLGHWELLALGVIFILLFVGPKKLPGFGKSLGESIRGFKKAMKEDDTLDVTDSAKHEQIEDQKAEGKKSEGKKSSEKKSEKDHA